MDSTFLIDMMFDGKPIEEFEKILRSGEVGAEWGDLLHMCYCEESYESVGGDEGHLPNPLIDHNRLAYLKALITLLKNYGVLESK